MSGLIPLSMRVSLSVVCVCSPWPVAATGWGVGSPAAETRPPLRFPSFAVEAGLCGRMGPSGDGRTSLETFPSTVQKGGTSEARGQGRGAPMGRAGHGGRSRPAVKGGVGAEG